MSEPRPDVFGKPFKIRTGVAIFFANLILRTFAEKRYVQTLDAIIRLGMKKAVEDEHAS